MKNYLKLKELIERKQVVIYFELSLPRSNSTAWQIALTEAKEIDGQINEPSFHPDLKSRRFEDEPDANRTLEDYFGRILERLEGNSIKKRAGLLDKTTRRPVGLIVNDLTHSIDKQDLKHILTLTDKIAITVRDPRIQGYSALLRVINDALDSLGGGNISPKMALSLANQTSFTQDELENLIGPGENKIDPAAVLSFLKLSSDTQLTPSILQRGIQQALERCKIDFLKICWDNLKQQIEYIKAEKQTAQFIVVDGTDLLAEPERIMEESAKALGVTYNPNMVYHWQKANKDNFYCCITKEWGELAYSNQWNGPVRKSEKLEKKPNCIASVPEVVEFPAALHEVLKECMKIYDDIRSNKCAKVSLPAPLFTPGFSHKKDERQTQDIDRLAHLLTGREKINQRV